ncbi:nucleoside diphosphate kinase regulator [Roseovarius aestuarii]|nr:nucleoside diphosphate kinase regulator [Roseovarius aestuarii]
MTSQTLNPVKKRSGRAPKVVISEAELNHIEALAEGAYQRNPTLADRLLEELSRARIVKAAKMPENVVSMGSHVVYRDETTGQETSITLVYPEHADIARQRVSLMTPIGVSLLGLSEGAVFDWNTRDNERRTLTVIRVRQPAAADTPVAGT